MAETDLKDFLAMERSQRRYAAKIKARAAADPEAHQAEMTAVRDHRRAAKARQLEGSAAFFHKFGEILNRSRAKKEIK